MVLIELILNVRIEQSGGIKFLKWGFWWHYLRGSCTWTVLVSCFSYQDYITQFKDILQCNGGFVVISVKLLLVFNLCMWRGKKRLLTQFQVLVFLLKQLYLLLLKQFMQPFAFCCYTSCQPPGHWLASLIIHKKIYFPLSAASSYVLDLSVTEGKPWMCFQATTDVS